MTSSRPLFRSIFTFVLTSLLATTALPAWATLRMTVTAETRNVVHADAKGPSSGTQQSEVVLGDDVISVHSGNLTQVFDFGKRRRYVLDEAAKTYDEYSLFDTVGFRDIEMRNRDGLRKALAAAKLEQKATSPIEDEHELSMLRPSPGMVATRTEGEDEVFAGGDVVLLRHGKAATPVSAAESARFVQYLRYVFAGHPAVLASLQKEHAIPAHLTYVFHPTWGDSTVDIKIAAVRHDDAPATLSLASYTPKSAGNDVATDATSLDALVDRAWVTRTTLAANARLPAPAGQGAPFVAPRPFEAFLALNEAQLSGAPLPSVSDEQKRAFQLDPDLRTLTQAMHATTPDALRQATGTLQALRPQARARAYVLKLFEANDRVRLGDLAGARSLFVDVLQANPSMVSAYKDIGDFYYRSFDTPRAWRSRDVARTLAPLYSTLTSVADYERTLSSRFPEYF